MKKKAQKSAAASLSEMRSSLESVEEFVRSWPDLPEQLSESERRILEKDPNSQLLLCAMKASLVSNPLAEVAWLEKGYQVAKEAVERHSNEAAKNSQPRKPGFSRGEQFASMAVNLETALWKTGNYERSLQTLREGLKQCPSIVPTILWRLFRRLIQLDRDDEARDLCRNAEDRSDPFWWVATALLAYRKFGDSPKAGKRLLRAQRIDADLLPLILGDCQQSQPSLNSGADIEEQRAFFQVSTLIEECFIPAWVVTPGALSWMRSVRNARVLKPADPCDDHLPSQIAALRDLPLAADQSWEIELIRLPNWYQFRRRVFRTHLMIITNQSGETIYQQRLPDFPDAARLMEELVSAADTPQTGLPLRPGKILLPDSPQYADVQKLLDPAGVQLVFTADRPLAKAAAQAVRDMTLAEELPGSSEDRKITDTDWIEFCQAAAAFYRAAPWKKFTERQGLELSGVPREKASGARSKATRYLKVLGTEGASLGLSLYSDIAALWSADPQTEYNFYTYDQLGLTFTEALNLGWRDLERMEQLPCEVANPGAYPVLVYADGLQLRPGNAAELWFATVALKAIVAWLAEGDNPTAQPFSFPIRSGKTTKTVGLRLIESKSD